MFNGIHIRRFLWSVDHLITMLGEEILNGSSAKWPGVIVLEYIFVDLAQQPAGAIWDDFWGGRGGGGRGFNLIKLSCLLYLFEQTGLCKQCRTRSDAKHSSFSHATGHMLLTSVPALNYPRKRLAFRVRWRNAQRYTDYLYVWSSAVSQNAETVHHENIPI